MNVFFVKFIIEFFKKNFFFFFALIFFLNMASSLEEDAFVEGLKFPEGTLALTFGQRLIFT